MEYDDGSGWRAFAGIMILISGTFNFIDGLVAVTKTNYFEQVANNEIQLPITNNIETWGWVAMGAGIVMVLAGLAIFTGSMWARVVGVIVAGLNAIFQLAYLAHFPFWSFTMILVDVLIIWALVVHGRVTEPAYDTEPPTRQPTPVS